VVRPFIPGWVKGDNMIEYLKQLNKPRNDEMLFKHILDKTKSWDMLGKMHMADEVEILLNLDYKCRYLVEVIA
jgi:hypothetical protein